MTATILTGDALEQLRTLPSDSVHTCVTSPPYFGLRDYGHEGQIGLEQTPAAYIAKLVAVFAEARRVLRDDGTLWVNIGDSYAGSWGNQGRTDGRGSQRAVNGPMLQRVNDGRYPGAASGTGSLGRTPGCKPKDLIGIPWLLAFALRADGWYLRQDIIWHKPNPMPESVTDRCTKAHEYVFLLSKSARYYYDHKAMQEPAVAMNAGEIDGGAQRGASGENVNAGRNYRGPGNVNAPKGQAAFEAGDAMHRTKAGLLAYAERARSQSFRREESKRAQAIPGQAAGTHRPDRPESEYSIFTRNRRSVWTVATQPYKGAHFAVFPPALIEPCILAGCPVGGLVLDPFNGSGTTGQVALELGRRYVGIELNSEYVELTQRRLAGITLGLPLEVAA